MRRQYMKNSTEQVFHVDIPHARPHILYNYTVFIYLRTELQINFFMEANMH